MMVLMFGFTTFHSFLELSLQLHLTLPILTSRSPLSTDQHGYVDIIRRTCRACAAVKTEFHEALRIPQVIFILSLM
jgi:hypothetical protein